MELKLWLLFPSAACDFWLNMENDACDIFLLTNSQNWEWFVVRTHENTQTVKNNQLTVFTLINCEWNAVKTTKQTHNDLTYKPGPRWYHIERHHRRKNEWAMRVNNNSRAFNGLYGMKEARKLTMEMKTIHTNHINCVYDCNNNKNISAFSNR